MNLYWKYLDDGDGAGADTGSAGADAAGADSGSGDEIDFSNQEQSKAAYEKLQGDLTAKSTAHDELDGKYQKLKSHAGEQGNDAGNWNALTKSLSNPDAKKEVLAALAKDAGIEVSFGNGSDLNTNQMKELLDKNPDELREYFEKASSTQSSKDIENLVNEKMAPHVKTMFEHSMAQKFEDWDGFSVDREAALDSVSTGNMSVQELAHMAVRASKIKEIQQAAYKKGAETKEAEIAEKMKGHGGGSAVYPKPTPEAADENKKRLGNALALIHTVRN